MALAKQVVWLGKLHIRLFWHNGQCGMAWDNEQYGFSAMGDGWYGFSAMGGMAWGQAWDNEWYGFGIMAVWLGIVLG